MNINWELKKIIKKILPRRLIVRAEDVLMVPQNYVRRKKDGEEKVSLGELNRGQTIYVMRPGSTRGLFSYVNTAAGRIGFALDRGYIPVIDMQNTPNPYLEDDLVGKENSWEYYFYQPSEFMDCSVSLKEAWCSRKVILSDPGGRVERYAPTAGIRNDPADPRYEMWKNIFRKYIVIRKELKEQFDAEVYSKWGNRDRRILGVLCRGTDYIGLKGHSVQPEPENVVVFARDKLREWGCDAVYLSTEDKRIVELFRNEFKDELIVIDRKYVDSVQKGLSIYDVHKNNIGARESGEEYLKQIYLLTRCDSVILSRTSATPAVLLWGEYSNTYIWDLGTY